jgi:hypothetical protein
MPRTPAPLTVEYAPEWAMWEVLDKNAYEYGGLLVGRFVEEADARAFVALPALIEAAKEALAVLTDGGEVQMGDGHAVDLLEAALAQADGPAPKEE